MRSLNIREVRPLITSCRIWKKSLTICFRKGVEVKAKACVHRQ